jgi:hypothetical protein
MKNTIREIDSTPLWHDPEEDWKATAERLQRCVSLLLIKNQRLRMALLETKASMQAKTD